MDLWAKLDKFWEFFLFVFKGYTCSFKSEAFASFATIALRPWGRWFSSHTPVSFTNKTYRHDITEILLKVALNTITLTHFVMCKERSTLKTRHLLRQSFYYAPIERTSPMHRRPHVICRSEGWVLRAKVRRGRDCMVVAFTATSGNQCHSFSF